MIEIIIPATYINQPPRIRTFLGDASAQLACRGVRTIVVGSRLLGGKEMQELERLIGFAGGGDVISFPEVQLRAPGGARC